MNILPKFCKSNATVNYSILNRFKPANIYRFFCLSLSRDDWYNVRITLDELKRTSGGKSVSSFNKKFEEYLDIKPYFVDNGFYYLTRRNIYHIPAMEEKCITISRDLLSYEQPVAVKGFFIQLILLSLFRDIILEKKSIISALNIDKKTYDKYLSALIVAGLVTDGKVLVLHTDSILLKNNFSMQKILSKSRLLKKDMLNVDIKSENAK